MRSQPDYIIYVPGHYDGSTNDSHNEHFPVFEGPDGSLMAIWKQSVTSRCRLPSPQLVKTGQETRNWLWI
jgi:hypothetical protein